MMKLAAFAGKAKLRWNLRRYSSATKGHGPPKVDSAGKPVDIPSQADVVVVGGGSVGCNTLYHLVKRGATNAVLLESHRLTAGTTWHTAGLVWRLRPNDVEIQLLNHTRQLLMTLEDETGINSGWINNGGLFVASTKERLDEYKRLMTIGRVFGVDSQVLTPSETKQLYPLMNTDDVYGTLYSPGDGTVDPAGFCSALTRSATRNGAKVIENCPVTGINYEESAGCKRVTGVRTPFGEIRTGKVVNCTGAWSPRVAAMIGLEIPLVAMKHAYVVTEGVPGVQNTPNVRDHDLSLYLRLQGDSLCIGGYESDPVILDSEMDPDFAFGLYELDWDVFGPHLERACHRVPSLSATGVRSTVCGPESFTPDHKPLMGEDPATSGFFHGCGFNSAGMMLGGGCGWQLADWVLDGRPSLDMYGYDIVRFSPGLFGRRDWCRERSHESYAKNYSTVFAHDEPLAGRKMRLAPLYHLLEQEGCVYQERLGWERPGWFSSDGPAPLLPYDYYGSYGHTKHAEYPYRDRLADDYSFDFPANHKQIESECMSCREAAAIFDMSYFGKFYMSGPDAQAAADWIFSNRMDGQPGLTVYTCMLNRNGGVESDLTVSLMDHDSARMDCEPHFKGRTFYLAAGGAAAMQNWAHVMRTVRAKGFQVELTDMSEQMGMLSLQGPMSRTILEIACPDQDWSNEAFPFSTHRLVNINGHCCRALRLSFVGELGWELHIPSESCVDVYKSVWTAGRPLGLKNAGYRAIDSLSLEKGYRHWHADVRPDDNPYEAGLGFTCKMKVDTPFLGRTALENRTMRKRLVCLTLDKKVPLWGLESIVRNGQIVGYLRRGDFGFAIGKSLGHGYISNGGQVVTAEYLKSGQYEVEVMGERFAARLHLKSPFDPAGNRLKGIYN